MTGEDIRDVVKLIAGQWRVPILFALAERPLRYSEIGRAIGAALTPGSLTHDLHRLKEIGLVGKTSGERTGGHDQYYLTPPAARLLPRLVPLEEWLEEVVDQINPDAGHVDQEHD
jgi:DNA-binding HxlR family transcriptional regulator